MLDIIEVLKPFYDATKQFSASQYVTISCVYPIYNALLSILEIETSDTAMKQSIKKILKYYLDKYIDKYLTPNESMLLAAQYLDVRTKVFGLANCYDVKSKYKKAQEYIKTLSDASVVNQTSNGSNNSTCASSSSSNNSSINDNSSSTSSAIPSSSSSGMTPSTRIRATTELNIFSFQPSVSLTKTQQKYEGIQREIALYHIESAKEILPMEYWKQNKETYPLLFECALKIFSIPATSVPCDRLFSESGYNIWDRRNRLAPESVDKMMVVYSNLKK